MQTLKTNIDVEKQCKYSELTFTPVINIKFKTNIIIMIDLDTFSCIKTGAHVFIEDKHRYSGEFVYYQ